MIKYNKIKQVFILSTILVQLILGTIPTLGISSFSENFEGAIYYVGGTGPNNFTSIQKALDIVNDGDSIFVFQGYYEELITIQNSINITGENKHNTIIDGGGNGTVVKIYSENVIMNNFSIIGCGGDFYDAGVQIIADYVTLYDHPDKYMDHDKGGPNPYISNGGEVTRLVKTDNSHWKLTNSTTMTFASKVNTLKQDRDIWMKHLD